LAGRRLSTTAFDPTMQSHSKKVFRGSAERGVKYGKNKQAKEYHINVKRVYGRCLHCGEIWIHPAIKVFSSASVGIKGKFFRACEWRDRCTGRAKIYNPF